MGYALPLCTWLDGRTLGLSGSKLSESFTSRNYPLVVFSSTSEFYKVPYQPWLVTLMGFLSLGRLLEFEAYSP
jgi:hypothetical protein